MLESVYGKKTGEALNQIVKSARALVDKYGLDPELVTNVQTVRGNSDRLRSLARLEATAALMLAVETAANEGGSVATSKVIYLGDIMELEGLSKTSAKAITAAFAQEGEEVPFSALVSLDAVLNLPGLTKTSREAITAAFTEEEEPEEEEA